MSEPSVGLLGFMGCPEDFVVSIDALGRQYTSSIGGAEIEIHFPYFGSTGPFASGPDSLIGVNLDSAQRLPGFWGVFRACGGIDSSGEASADSVSYLTVSVKHVGFRISTADAETFHRVVEEMESFWSRSVKWCAVLEDARDGRAVFKPPRFLLCEPRLAAESIDGLRMPLYQSTGGGVGAQEMGFSSATLTQAFDAVGRGIEIPLPWQLLLDARSHLLEFEFRRSVIDACSACETAYAHLFLRMKGNSPNAQRQLERFSGLKSRAEKLGKMLSSGDPQYQFFSGHRDRLPELDKLVEDVAKPRNSAAHEGDALSYGQASAAVSMADRVVRELLPRGLLE